MTTTREVDDRVKKLRISIHAKDIETEAEEYAEWLRRGIITNHFLPFEGKTLHIVELLEALAELCRRRKRRSKLFSGKQNEKKPNKSEIEILEKEIISYREENKRLRCGFDEVKKENVRLHNLLMKQNVMYEELLAEAGEMWKVQKRRGFFAAKEGI